MVIINYPPRKLSFFFFLFIFNMDGNFKGFYKKFPFLFFIVYV